MVSFNINPFLVIRSIIPETVNNLNQILIRSFSHIKDPVADIYKLILFSHIYLDCMNIRFHVNVLRNQKEIKLINAVLTNLKGVQVNILIGKYRQNINQIEVFDQNNLVQLEIPENRFFNDNEILKHQLDALYNDKQLVELNQGAHVADLVQKIQERSYQESN
jgi:hypothetical protein